MCPQVRDILSRSPAWDEERGLSYTPCLLIKPVLRLRLHATQSQPCFPAASNALALPVGNLIFAATPTERITHYTLQAKSCAKGIPFGNPILSERVATLPPKCKISGCNLLQNHSRIDRLFCCIPPSFPLSDVRIYSLEICLIRVERKP